jgi:hypothetical protein
LSAVVVIKYVNNSLFAILSKSISQLVIPKDTHKGHPYITIDSKFKLVFGLVVSVESCVYLVGLVCGSAR